MTRRLLNSLVLAFACLSAACGDPLVVMGDLPGFMRLVAGVANEPGVRLDSIAVNARLQSPAGLVLRENGDLIVTDHARRILTVSPSGRFRVLYQSPGCVDESCMVRPQGIALQGDALLIADDQTDRIWRFDLNGRQITSIAGNSETKSSPDGTLAQDAPLASPTDIAIAPDNRILFVERGSNRIRAIGTDGRLQTIAGNGELGRAGDGGPATSAQLNQPGGIAVAENTLFITDNGNNLIRAVDLSTGTIRTVAGTGIGGYSGDGGAALDAKLNQPWSIVATPDASTIYFTELGNHVVRTVNLATGQISTFAGTGSTTYTGNGRPAGQTSLNFPRGLYLSDQGFLFISDSEHHIVWRTTVRL